MQQLIGHRVQMAFICIIGLVLMLLVTACSGVSSTSPGSTTTIRGTLVSVNASQHSATVNVNGQQVTVGGLTDQQVTALQSQLGKAYSLQVTGSGNAYTIVPNTTPELSETPEANATPPGGVTQSPTTFAPGSLDFMGTVRSVSPSSLSVSMPDGSTLAMSITALTDRSHFGGGLPTSGQLIKVEATANADGSFTATKLDTTDANDVVNQNIAQYQGLSTSAVGADRIIHFKVGTKTYSFPIGTTADLSDFAGNAQAIQANQIVKVKVQYAGSTATVLKVERSNG